MLISTLRYIYKHPFNKRNPLSGIYKFFLWQISYRLFNFPILYPLTKNASMLICKGQAGATGNLYCGLMEYYDMSFLLHFLREDDLFIDIGSNIGVYTLLATAEKGATSIAIEPVPSTFNHLKRNIDVNAINDKATLYNIGLSNKNGSLRFTTTMDAANHVASDDDKEGETISVEVRTLDSLIEDKFPSLIKIDVEGFETEVLDGGEKVISNPKLEAIIIELNGSGKRYGYDEDKIHQKLLGLGYKPFHYDPDNRELEELKIYGDMNTIYIRDLAYVSERLKSSRKVEVANRSI